MLDKMYANASEDVRNLSNTIRENEDAQIGGRYKTERTRSD
jgi:hypothetical protein